MSFSDILLRLLFLLFFPFSLFTRTCVSIYCPRAHSFFDEFTEQPQLLFILHPTHVTPACTRPYATKSTHPHVYKYIEPQFIHVEMTQRALNSEANPQLRNRRKLKTRVQRGLSRNTHDLSRECLPLYRPQSPGKDIFLSVSNDRRTVSFSVTSPSRKASNFSLSTVSFDPQLC